MNSSVLLAIANEIRAVYEERDALRESAKTWREAESETAKQWRSAVAELTVMTAQRDSWFAKATTLAEQLHALQSATPTPAAEPVNLDGFRVGDLVLAPGSDGRVSRIVGVQMGIKLSTHEWHHNADPSKLTRKPVEVGDTVRTRYSNRAVVAQGPDSDGRVLFEEDGTIYSAPLCTCIAIAPTVAP